MPAASEWAEIEKALRAAGSSDSFVEQAEQRFHRSLAKNDFWRTQEVIIEILNVAGHTKDIENFRSIWKEERKKKTLCEIISCLNGLGVDGQDMEIALDYVDRHLTATGGPNNQAEYSRLCDIAEKIAIESKAKRQAGEADKWRSSLVRKDIILRLEDEGFNDAQVREGVRLLDFHLKYDGVPSNESGYDYILEKARFKASELKTFHDGISRRNRKKEEADKHDKLCWIWAFIFWVLGACVIWWLWEGQKELPSPLGDIIAFFIQVIAFFYFLAFGPIRVWVGIYLVKPPAD